MDQLGNNQINVVIANVKGMLRTYDEAGLILDSDLYRWAYELLGKVGSGALIESEDILDIENYKVKLPENFTYLWSAQFCNLKNFNNTKTTRWDMPGQSYAVIKDYTNNVCFDRCDIRRDDSLQEVTRTYHIDNVEYVDTYCNRELIMVSKKSSSCCINKSPSLSCQSKYEASIDKKNMYFNVSEGSVHIQYYGMAIDDDGLPFVEDNQHLTKAVEDYLIYMQLYQMFLNSEADVAQKIQIASQMHRDSLSQVKYEYKLGSKQQYLDYAKERSKRFSIFNLDGNTI